jgi:hypothetical protein
MKIPLYSFLFAAVLVGSSNFAQAIDPIRSVIKDLSSSTHSHRDLQDASIYTNATATCELALTDCNVHAEQLGTDLLTAILAYFDPTGGQLSSAIVQLVASLASGAPPDISLIINIITIIFTQTGLFQYLISLISGAPFEALLNSGSELGTTLNEMMNHTYPEGRKLAFAYSSAVMIEKVNEAQAGFENIIVLIINTLLDSLPQSTFLTIARVFINMIENLFLGGAPGTSPTPSPPSGGTPSPPTGGTTGGNKNNKNKRQLHSEIKQDRRLKGQGNMATDKSPTQRSRDLSFLSSTDIAEILKLIEPKTIKVPHLDHFHAVSTADEAYIQLKSESSAFFDRLRSMASSASSVTASKTPKTPTPPSPTQPKPSPTTPNQPSQPGQPTLIQLIIQQLQKFLTVDVLIQIVQALIKLFQGAMQPPANSTATTQKYSGSFYFLEDLLALTGDIAKKPDGAPTKFMMAGSAKLVASLAITDGLYQYVDNTFPGVFKQSISPVMEEGVSNIESELQGILSDATGVTEQSTDTTVKAAMADGINCRLDLLSCEAVTNVF